MWLGNNICLFLVLVVAVLQGNAVRIAFPGCDRAGWKCIKVQPSPIRYLIEFACPNTDGVQFSLWNFNAPGEIKEFRVTNCSSVEIDLTCTNQGRLIETLYLQNIGILNFTNILYKDVAQMPEKVFIKDVQLMPLIPEKTFKQMKVQPASVHRCAVVTKPVDRITFNNVSIGTIQQNAFHNLTQMKQFEWDHVVVDTMEPLALQVEMDKDKSFNISNSSFNKLDYKALSLRSPSIKFDRNKFKELPRNVIDATSFQFNFFNNTIEKIHSFAFILLSQDIFFEHNKINSLKTSALQGIGPGLLENAFMSFGQLQFTYSFQHNKISHSDIGGLNPDWAAYKNVRSYIYVASNYLPCSCKELGWITLRGGLGDEFSEMMTFNAKFLDKDNKNLCDNSPCNLPVTVMAGMFILFGQCGYAIPLMNWCKKFNPSNTKDYGLGQSAKIILNKWHKDFPVMELSDEAYSSEEMETLENLIELSLKTENVYSDRNKFKFAVGKSNDSYFKIEKTGLIDMDPVEYLEQMSDPTDIVEPKNTINTENQTLSPISYVDENGTVIVNGSTYSYQTDLKGEGKPESASSISDKGFANIKKEYEEEQKNFVKKTHQEWQNSRKKRMVYFKVFGNLMTIDP